MTATDTYSLSALNLQAKQDYGQLNKDKSVGGHPLSITGKQFERGLGTRADSSIFIWLNGNAERFIGSVGVDDEAGGRGSVRFKLIGDGQTLWESHPMLGGDTALPVSVNLESAKMLVLMVEDAGDVSSDDHADWCDARVVMFQGKPEAVTTPVDSAVILTPGPSPCPRINGAKVLGVRPGSPFFYTIAATGTRPMRFAVDNLPEGLQLNPETGRITGVLHKKGDYSLTLHAKNALGDAQRKFAIVCGSQIGLAPAVGWNSWNCFASAVTAQDIRNAADAMVKSGLINHGWTYINIDDYWQVHRNSKDPTLQGPQRDNEGRILPNPRFSDMKALANYVHSKGLRIGLYSSPGSWTCGGCVGSYQHEEQDARQYADWGFDYLKYDWCSYNNVARGDHSRAALEKPYDVMRKALDKVPRDIVYSLCQYGMGNVWEWGAKVGGNSWRTTGDITDTWLSISRIGFSQDGRERYAGPGHFNDPDMLVLGKVGWGQHLHPTRLTASEQYTHISLWCLLDAPLLIGCDMTQLDPFTLSLLTNDEVLEVDQDPLGRQACRVAKDGDLEVWAKDMEDGSKAVGLFNRGEEAADITVRWADLGVAGKQLIRDLWRQMNLGEFLNSFRTEVPSHGVVLTRMWASDSK